MADIGDTISSDQPGAAPPPPERVPAPRGIGTRATAMSAALTLVLAGGVATAAYRSTTSDRDPAVMVPANAFAAATIHLDLPGGQEQAVDQILANFPGVHLPGSGSLKDRVMRALTSSSSPPVDYDKDIKPWLGNTATFAGWLDNGRPKLEMVLASTDDAAARAHLPATMGSDEHFVVRDGFVVMGSNLNDINDAITAAASASLADHGDYSPDIAALPGDEAATAWIDGPAVKGLLGTMFGGGPAGASAFGGLGLFGATGLGDLFNARIALGLRATDHYVQLDLRQVGGHTYDTAPSTLLTQLPATTIGALELGDPGAVVDGVAPLLHILGSFTAGSTTTCSSGVAVVAPVPTLRQLRRQLQRSLAPGTPHRRAVIRSVLRNHRRALAIQRRAAQNPANVASGHCTTTPSSPPTDPLATIQQTLGISFPDDVKTILGSRAVVAFGGIELGSAPDIAIRSHPTDLSAAQSLAGTLQSHLSAATGLQIATTTANDDMVLATSTSYAAEIAKSGSLGDAAQVRTALGDLPGDVSVAGYVDLSRIWPLLGAHVPAALQQFKAVGLWGDDSGNVATGQLRLVIG